MSEARPYKDSRKREEVLENEKERLARELELSRNDRDTDIERQTEPRPDTIAVPKTEDDTRQSKDDTPAKQGVRSKVASKEKGEEDADAETLDDVKREDRYKASPGS